MPRDAGKTDGDVSIELQSLSMQHLGLNNTSDNPSLHRLPVELLMLVIEDLGLYDRLNLALACRYLFSTLEKDVALAKEDFCSSRELAANSKDPRSREEVMREANAFLRGLVRAREGRYWHCEECMLLHARHIKSMRPPGSLAKLSNLLGILGLQQGAEEQVFCIRIQRTTLYEISFSTAQAVMDRHARKATGVCVNALRCSGVYDSPSTQEDSMILRYAFEPRIVLDRLLLKATYTWESVDSKRSPTTCRRFGFQPDDEIELVRKLVP